MIPENARLRLRPGFEVTVLSPDEIQVRSCARGRGVIAISDPSRSGYLADLFRRLDGTHTVDDLLRSVPPARRGEVSNLLRAMARRHLQFTSEPEAASLSDQLPALSRYLNIRFDRPQAAGRALEQAHLGLIGTGVVGSRLTIALAQAGVGRITLFDDQLVGPEDRALSPAFATVPVGEPRAVALSEVVNGMMGRQVVHPLHTDACEAEPLHTYDLVLVAEDRHSPTLCQAVNTRALKQGFAWAAVSVDGLRGYAGPILIPGDTGCYRCYEATDPYVLKAAHSHQAYLHHLESQSSRSGGPFTGLTAFADILVGFVVADLPAFLVEGRSQLLGQSVDFDFETLSMESRAVSRFPHCPTCGSRVQA